ncbi:MAG TPA: hypothetical protein VH143_30450 [Kofleriaceae bacterium]|jgi:hypothetical protein|nr:hypothetical protein [Kofleriaceae bacterium]
MRGLVVLAAIAAVLAVVVALHRTIEPVDRAILPGFTGDAHELRWQRAVGDMAITRAGDRWLMGTRTLDAHAIDGVIAALRGAHWHRRAERARAGAIHATLFVDGRGVSIGESIAGVDQTWLVIDGHAELVDGWVARSLEPQPIALVDREPFAAAASSELHVSAPELALTGTPRRSALGVVSPARVGALVHALAAIELVRLPTLPAAGATVTLGARPIVVGGKCAADSPLLALHAATGDGCIEPAAWQAVVAAATALASPDALDPRPAGFPIARAGELDLAKPAGLDPDRVAELVSALAAPGELVAPATGAALRSIAITPRGGEPIWLDVFAGVVQRRGEPRAIRVAPTVLATLARPAHWFADATRWAEDPASITRIAIDGATYDRGATLGEWTRTPPGAVDAALVSALGEALATVRAPDEPVPAGFRAVHRIAVTFAPPVGAAATHQLEIGAGCHARIDGVDALAPMPLCMAAAAAAH